MALLHTILIDLIPVLAIDGPKCANELALIVVSTKNKKLILIRSCAMTCQTST